MSWQVFKNNLIQFANNPDGINDTSVVAKKWADEYDAAVKRGRDVLNQVSIKKGNKEAMEQLFKVALDKGMSSTEPYDLVGEMGKGVIAYWTGATLNEFPIPIIPAVGATANVAVISNIVLNAGTWQPAANVPGTTPYDKLDWSKIPLDKDDPEVQAIINPAPDKLNERIAEDARTNGEGYSSEGAAAVTQLNNQKAEIIDKALYDQKIIEEKPEQKIEADKLLKSGYKNLDELLKIAGAWAPKLGKNPRVCYENLKQGYIAGIHGLCPQGTQSVVVALTGVKGLGTLTGNADWFSFKNPSTGGGRSSFAVSIGGKVYYNDKVKIDSSYTLNPSAWQVGDIVVMGYTEGKPYGHIQCWTGFKWVSDFTQNKIQSNHVDTSSIALWRLNENGKAAVQSQKNKA